MIVQTCCHNLNWHKMSIINFVCWNCPWNSIFAGLANVLVYHLGVLYSVGRGVAGSGASCGLLVGSQTLRPRLTRGRKCDHFVMLRSLHLTISFRKFFLPSLEVRRDRNTLVFTSDRELCFIDVTSTRDMFVTRQEPQRRERYELRRNT